MLFSDQCMSIVVDHEKHIIGLLHILTVSYV